jgi:general secretion pathway protein G
VGKLANTKKMPSALSIVAGLTFCFVLFVGYVIFTTQGDPIGPQKSRVERTKNYLREVSQQLFRFKNDCGAFPTTQQGLKALVLKPESKSLCLNWSGPYEIKLQADPWGSDFIYSSDGQTFTLMSLGRDKKEGGVGYDADIVVNSSQPTDSGNSK